MDSNTSVSRTCPCHAWSDNQIPFHQPPIPTKESLPQRYWPPMKLISSSLRSATMSVITKLAYGAATLPALARGSQAPALC